MKNINKDLKKGDVVRLRKDIMDDDWRYDSPVGWCEDMNKLIGKKVTVAHINGTRYCGLSFQIEDDNLGRHLTNYGYSSSWFEYPNSIDDEVEEL